MAVLPFRNIDGESGQDYFAAGMATFYGIVVAGASGSIGHLVAQGRTDWYLLAPIVTGFGVQVGLVAELRRRRRLARDTAVAGAAGAGGSTVGMIACCAHHVAEVAPFGGFQLQYQVNLDPVRLAAHGIPIQRVVEAIRANNDDVGGRLPWSAFRSFVRQDAQQPHAALYRVLTGPDGQWKLTEHLLAAAVDTLAVANWQRASSGKRKPKKPQPIPRPGLKRRRRRVAGDTAVPMSQARSIFEARNPSAHRAWVPPHQDGGG